MSVHARHVLAAGLSQGQVEAIGRAPGGVVDHAHARVGGSEPLESLPRSVARVAFRENELDLSLADSLREDRRDRLLEHRGLVQDRGQHAYRHRGALPWRSGRGASGAR